MTRDSSHVSERVWFGKFENLIQDYSSRQPRTFSWGTSLCFCETIHLEMNLASSQVEFLKRRKEADEKQVELESIDFVISFPTVPAVERLTS